MICCSTSSEIIKHQVNRNLTLPVTRLLSKQRSIFFQVAQGEGDKSLFWATRSGRDPYSRDGHIDQPEAYDIS